MGCGVFTTLMAAEVCQSASTGVQNETVESQLAHYIINKHSISIRFWLQANRNRFYSIKLLLCPLLRLILQIHYTEQQCI